MNLQGYRVILLFFVGVMVLVVASPALQRLLIYPQTEFFSEQWLLGPDHLAANYPYNIRAGENYRVYLGVGNRLGSCGYYCVQVKLRNQTQSAPDSLKRTPSSLKSLYNIYTFIGNNASWELPIAFSFTYTYDVGSSKILFESLLLNDVSLDISSFSSSWNPEDNVRFADLVFELWLYDEASGDFLFHERFVDLKFNMTI